jgi:hypothetical protein
MKRNFENIPFTVIRKDLLSNEEEKISFADAMKRLENYYLDLDDIEKRLYSGLTVTTPYANFSLERIEKDLNLNINL